MFVLIVQISLLVLPIDPQAAAKKLTSSAVANATSVATLHNVDVPAPVPSTKAAPLSFAMFLEEDQSVSFAG